MRKITRFAGVGLVGLMLLVLTGCGAQKGVTRVKYERGSEPQLSEAPSDGQYALYTMTDLTPQVVRRLEQGDKLGFRKRDDGKIEAVAGDHATVLDSKTVEAYWKKQKE